MQVSCPACKKTLEVNPELAGKTVKCVCGQPFAVPGPSTSPTGGAAQSKITVQCSCGKLLQAPVSAAGKALKCPCGQVVPVPAANPTHAGRVAHGAASPRPFDDISDDEWKGMVAQFAPRPEDDKPKEKTAAQKLMDEARKDTGNTKSMAREGAERFLDTSRWIFVGLGVVLLAVSIYDLYMLNSFIEMLAGANPEGEEDLDLELIKTVLFVFGCISIGLSVLFMVFGFLIFIFPMTCSICGLLLYTLLELLRLLNNPFILFDLRGWIVRIAIFGALIQAINNAAYYRFVKAQEREERKKMRGR